MFGVRKSEYERVVKANNEMRIKLEKMRLENALLKDQIRALKRLPSEESSLYIFLQLNESASLDDIMANPDFSGAGKAKIIESLEKLMEKGLIDTSEKDGVDYYSIKSADWNSPIPPSAGMLK